MWRPTRARWSCSLRYVLLVFPICNPAYLLKTTKYRKEVPSLDKLLPSIDFYYSLLLISSNSISFSLLANWLMNIEG